MPGRRRQPQPADQWDLFALLAEQHPDAAAETAPAAPPPPPPELLSPAPEDFAADQAAGDEVSDLFALIQSAPPTPPPAPGDSTGITWAQAPDPASGDSSGITAAPDAGGGLAVEPVRFQHPGTATVPAAPMARAAANLAALATLRRIQGQDRYATPAEQTVLAGWSGWGALPHVFDAPADHDGDRWWPNLFDRLIPPRLALLLNTLPAVDPRGTVLDEALIQARALAGTAPDDDAARALTAVVRLVPHQGEDSPAGRYADGLVDRIRMVATAATWDPVRAELNTLTSTEQRLAAARSTLNAHYTEPRIAAAMWQTLADLGHTGGRVLEPGCGSGNFLAHAPAGVQAVGVELDPTTAAIAAALYPHAQVITGGFEARGWNPGAFTAAIGNVPFGNFRLYDPQFNPHGLSVHNHFLAKALQLTAPGGVVALLTSAWTMDAANSAGRRELHGYGDLLGAVRLPTAAFRDVAGTDVVTDILVLRRRRDGETPLPFAEWEKVLPVDTPAGTVTVNTWFAAHPDLIVGELTAGHGRYRAAETTVTAADGMDVPAEVADRLAVVVDRARQLGLTVALDEVDPAALPAARQEDPGRWDEQARPGAIRVEADGRFSRLDPASRSWQPHPIPPQDRVQARALLELRDAVTALIVVQQTGADESDRDAARQLTRDRYDAYAAQYGPINRYSLDTAAAWVLVTNIDADDIDPDWPTRHKGADKGRPEYTETGDPVLQVRRETVVQKRPRAVEALRSDPQFAAVLALEMFDDDTQTCTPAPILTRDILTAGGRPAAVATAADALAVVLDATGAADLSAIADLVQGAPSPAQVRAALGELVYDDPDTGQLIPAARYLSGHVRSRLAAAEAAAAHDDRYAVNVAALTGKLPPTLGPADIEARPGVTWVEPRDYVLFIEEVLGIPRPQVTWSPLVGTWEVQSRRGGTSRANTTVFGVPTHTGLDLLTSLMNNAPVSVTKLAVDFNGREVQVPDPDATEAANAKRSALADRFGQWLWAEPDRAARLTEVYNDRFNSWVDPVYDGSHLTLPGLGSTFTPRPTQTAAVARIVDQPTVLLDHVVGAGKTGTMVMAAMELRRLGLARQPWIVVPNHIAEQVAREAKQWYPGAMILAGAQGATDKQRREFIALTATGDYDLVVVPESLFTAVPVSPDTEASFLADQVEQLRAGLAARADAKDRRGRSDTTKRIEAAVNRLETRIGTLRGQGRAGRDTGLTFESSGADYLFIDEAHHYKNRMVASSTRDLARDKDSQRALDLVVKLTALRQRRADTGAPDRYVTFATGTPIANSPREMWVMLGHLRPDLLETAGVEHFDAWAANHLRPQTRLEMKPTGSGFQPKTRITQFVNVPEMSQMWRQVADLVTRDTMPVRLPQLAGGVRAVLSAERTADQADFAAQLEERAAQVRSRMVRPEEDNMLAITGDGRKAALDQRLVGLPTPDDGGRPTAVAAEIFRRWQASAGRVYTDPATGGPHPRPGGLQLVFLDQSTPRPGQWSVYRQIRDELVALGMPRELVRFIHDAPPGPARTELFAACRDGRVAVLVGSTAKLGTGANIQDRLLALHHVDVPWRPADLEQREGRILRQGNQNDQVDIVAYVTENTFDAFSWNLVAVKAAFIAQIKNGTTARHVDADDFDSASYEQIAAISSGDPRILERYQLGVDLAALERLERAHRAEQRSLQAEIRGLQATVGAAEESLTFARRADRSTVSTVGDSFTATIGGSVYTERAAAGRHLHHELGAAFVRAGRTRGVDALVGELGGHLLRLHAQPGDKQVTLSVPDYADPAGRLPNHLPFRSEDLADTGNTCNTAGLGLVRRVENLVAGLPRAIADLQATVDAGPAKLDELRGLIGVDFPRGADLIGIRGRIHDLDKELVADAQDPELDGPTPPWMQGMSPEARDKLVTGGRLGRLRPDSTARVEQLHVGDILASPLANTNPRRITHIGGGTSPWLLTVEDIVTGLETELSKRPSTVVGVVALNRDHLSAFQTAIVDAAPTDRIITEDDLRVGDRITGNAVDPDTATRRPATLTVAAIDRTITYLPGRAGIPTLVLTDAGTGSRTLLLDQPGTRLIRHPQPAATRATGPAARTPDTARQVIPLESPAPPATVIPLESAPTPSPAAPPAAAERAPEVIPVESPTQPAVAGHQPAVAHGPAGTIVTGTSRDDTQLLTALKGAGFKWSRSQAFWYLPRNQLIHTRTLRVQQIVGALARQGRELPVTTHPDDTRPAIPTSSPSPAAAGAHLFDQAGPENGRHLTL